MSTGRRLAKRSIIGTKVCALGADALWYSGVIQDVKSSAPNATITTVSENSQALETCSETKYIVRFDFKTQIGEISERDYAGNNSLLISPAQTLRRNAMIKEFLETELIGPGFRSIIDIQLQSGQRVYVTHNGRETSGDVVQHDAVKDEVMLKIMPMGCEEPIVLKKRLEEVRLLESRRSARLAYQERNTDFARLADMDGGEKRRSSYTIDVPSLSTSTGIATACPPTTAFTPQHHSRKRPPSGTYECFGCEKMVDEEEMNECNAAMILVTLSLSPKSPKNGEKWLASSPGSSSASWSSGSSSPPLSDDGHNVLGATSTNDATSNARNRTTSVSTSDEGIVVDFKEETPRKKRANKTKFVCTFPGCKLREHTKTKIERHIRMVHLGSQKKPRRSLDQNDDYFVDSDSHEEEFYYTEIEDDDDDYKTPSPASPPTLSHRDMARPPHEDPEYQRQSFGNFKQGRITQQQQIIQKNHSKALQSNVNSLNQQQRQLQNNNNNNINCMPTSPLAYHNYTWPPNNATSMAPISPVYINNNEVLTLQQQQQQPTQTIIKHTRTSPSQSITPYSSPTYVHQQHYSYSSSVANSSGTIIQQYHDSSSSSKGMLQQLSQHNITVTAHHGSNSSHQQPPQHHHQQQQHLATVTITPNYGPHTIRTGTKPHEASLQQQQQQQQPHQQQISTATGNIGVNKTTTTPIANTNAVATIVASVSTGNLHQTQSGPNKHTPNSPNRRTRGENKKCRKVYGMDRRELWCTQCRWKKACSRFGD